MRRADRAEQSVTGDDLNTLLSRARSAKTHTPRPMVWRGHFTRATFVCFGL